MNSFVYGNIFFHLKQNLIVGEYPFNHTMLDTAIARWTNHCSTNKIVLQSNYPKNSISCILSHFQITMNLFWRFFQLKADISCRVLFDRKLIMYMLDLISFDVHTIAYNVVYMICRELSSVNWIREITHDTLGTCN